jgi:hypothetical protein
MKIGKRVWIGILLLTISLVSIALPASAYVYNGYYWHSGYAQISKASTIPSSWATSLNNGASVWTNAGADFHFSWLTSSTSRLYYSSLGVDGAPASTIETFSGTSMTKCKTYFNSDKQWSTSGESNKIDVQSVAAHEFGHWLSLNHSTNPDATMYMYVYRGDIKMRDLHSDDIAGIRSIYP